MHGIKDLKLGLAFYASHLSHRISLQRLGDAHFPHFHHAFSGPHLIWFVFVFLPAFSQQSFFIWRPSSTFRVQQWRSYCSDWPPFGVASAWKALFLVAAGSLLLFDDDDMTFFLHFPVWHGCALWFGFHSVEILKAYH